MSNYKPRVLEILSGLSGETPSSAPVISVDEFHASVLKMLGAAAGESPAEHRNYPSEVLRLLAAMGATAPADNPPLTKQRWRGELLRMLAELSSADPSDDIPISVDAFEARVLTLLEGISGGDLPDGYTRLAGMSFDSDCYFVIDGFYMRGSDTVRFTASINKACNVFGSYTSTAALDNYSLYVSTASNAKYLRYDGSTYKSYWRSQDFGVPFDIVITPTGSQGMPGTQDDTWAEASFTSPAELCIGTTSTSATSAKFDGSLLGDFIVDGRLHLIPCENDQNTVGYYDKKSKTFYAPSVGTPTPIYIN